MNMVRRRDAAHHRDDIAMPLSVRRLRHEHSDRHVVSSCRPRRKHANRFMTPQFVIRFLPVGIACATNHLISVSLPARSAASKLARCALANFVLLIFHLPVYSSSLISAIARGLRSARITVMTATVTVSIADAPRFAANDRVTVDGMGIIFATQCEPRLLARQINECKLMPRLQTRQYRSRIDDTAADVAISSEHRPKSSTFFLVQRRRAIWGAHAQPFAH